MMSEFLQMGGYARYVWPAYGLTFALLALHALLPWLRERRLRREAAAGARPPEPRA